MSIELVPRKTSRHLGAICASEHFDRFANSYIDSIWQAIADWVYEEALTDKKADKPLNSVENPDSPAEEGLVEDEWVEAQVWSEELGEWICGLAPKRLRTESPERPERDEAMPPAKLNTPGTPNPNSGGNKGDNKGCKKGKGKGKGPKGGCYS